MCTRLVTYRALSGCFNKFPVFPGHSVTSQYWRGFRGIEGHPGDRSEKASVTPQSLAGQGR
ncbi:hypothetical protein PUN4_360007 [Paraburkholderia unamae]|nr:hypothetical protein PUN4_360007 [Paraburkholderia unamae]